MTPAPPFPVLVFDGDCSFCTSAANKARAWLRLPQVEPWQNLDLDELGLTTAECSAALQWVDRQGQVRSGHLAIASALRYRGGAWGMVGRGIALPGLNQLSAVVYRLIARNRHRLPGGTPACRLGDAKNR